MSLSSTIPAIQVTAPMAAPTREAQVVPDDYDSTSSTGSNPYSLITIPERQNGQRDDTESGQHLKATDLEVGAGRDLPNPQVEPSELLKSPNDDHSCGHKHYSHRAPWLRALVLGANDGLVSIASLMLGVGAVSSGSKSMMISGLAGLVAGACSMAIGEFVSVFSQRDSEKADVEKERQEHAKGPEAEARELEELAQIYVERGLTYSLAKQVAVELSRVDVIKAHARDELGIDMDDYSNPVQAAVASAIAFASGGAIPLLAGSFIATFKYRLVSVVISTTFALAMFGAIGARLGGAPMLRAAMRVLVGGWLAMLITYAVLRLFSFAGV